MRSAVGRLALACCALALVGLATARVESIPGAASFASEIARLSEAEGNFDTDNLISNERGYLQVIPALVSGRVTGGVYIGVGPDQNFSYIARIKPTIAYIIDIRRDNLLLHLLFKALFARSHTRAEYLSFLAGRAPPSDLARWKNVSIADLCSYIDAAKPVADVEALRKDLDRTVMSYGVPVSRADLATLDRFHRTFIDAGLGLQFKSFGRPPQPYYPTLRDLLLAADANGRTWNYLASEDDFQFLKSLEARDGIVPVVGNIAGDHAMRAIAETISSRRQEVSAFYVSNIETYLQRDGLFGRFVQNVERLPRNEHSVIIRSIFGGGGASTSVVEPLSPRTVGRSPGRQ